MSIEQWVSDMLLCILVESNVEIRSQMLLYFSQLMQDAIELLLGTARRAHAAGLQEVERGTISWGNSEGIEKCRNRYIQRLL